MALTKIISGAQTGADRAGLDAALHLGLEVGGWIPLGRRTDEGPLSIEDFIRYRLREHPSAGYPGRTEQNVREAEATVLFGDMGSPGCSLTTRLCRMHSKTYLCNPTAEQLIRWTERNRIKVMNVAGNRERTNLSIYQRTFDTLVEALR